MTTRAAEQGQSPRWDLDDAVAVLASTRARASAWPPDLTEDQPHAAVDRWLADHGITAAEDSTLRRIEPANSQPGMLLDGGIRKLTRCRPHSEGRPRVRPQSRQTLQGRLASRVHHLDEEGCQRAVRQPLRARPAYYHNRFRVPGSLGGGRHGHASW
ncbi:hypothetical protein [Roseomonas genomospecies 6]|uniref:Uncharacterized protein n=1 Tax=Roseomonas genomospecies 6 TaxID=214106 RepID=A0A9W7NIF2_9PROT|nr:hypothetical protein [Roseomonas genomospecies 6]KAA0679551.1 hypothetical protein DS843_16585 [Roseomonas genomospecies 6]